MPMTEELSKPHVDVLQMPQAASWSLSRLSHELLELFPEQEAEEWDRTGLLAGDPSAQVTGIAVALDPTVFAVKTAKAIGANVLLTHHPAFIDAPERFLPAGRGAMGGGTVVYEALADGVALMNFHTTLDVSERAAAMLPGMLQLRKRSIVDVRYERTGHGYGQLCDVRPEDDPFTLRHLAARATSVFGRQPRVWGDLAQRLQTVVTCTGSQGDLASRCISAGYDALVCGEIRYHDALAAAQAGLAIVELGHDVSELPLCATLAAALEEIGFPDDGVKIIDQGSNWSVPETIRK